MQNPCLNPTADQTYEVIGEGPYNFAKVLARTREMERAGNVEEACNERFQAFQRFAELVPEDEEVNLEWPANCGCRPKTYGVSGPDSSGRCARRADGRQELRRRRV